VIATLEEVETLLYLPPMTKCIGISSMSATLATSLVFFVGVCDPLCALRILQ